LWVMSIKNWITGARVRTLPLAVAPIVLGSASADLVDRFDPLLALLALLVALLLQIGVNYANDYSDGIRGTDANRVGPLRLTGSGLVRPQAVKFAAALTFGLAALAGLAIVLLTGQWWLIAVGVLCIIAAWYYTGGKSPYGYAGLGEIAVFVFFGLIATVGTAYIQILEVDAMAVLLGINFGFYATAVLLVNNIRDVATDRASGKNTLSVRIGVKASKWLFGALLILPVVFNLFLAALYPATIIGLANLMLVFPAFMAGVRGKTAKDYISALKLTSFAGLGFGLLVGLGLFVVSF
jgi:1,4-dihydroxy-2-naphthoate polyprenyltransferase